jgi:hypothetical protein
MEKHFIDPEILSVFLILKVFPCTTQIALFLAKTAPCPGRSMKVKLILSPIIRGRMNMMKWSRDDSLTKCFDFSICLQILRINFCKNLGMDYLTELTQYCKITYFRVGLIFREGGMIVKIKPANMKIFKGFSITTLPKMRILDCCKDTI